MIMASAHTHHFILFSLAIAVDVNGRKDAFGMRRHAGAGTPGVRPGFSLSLLQLHVHVHGADSVMPTRGLEDGGGVVCVRARGPTFRPLGPTFNITP